MNARGFAGPAADDATADVGIHLTLALRYAAAGIAVFPVALVWDGTREKWNKVPLVKDWENAASTDENTIRTWWARSPEAAIGIPMGRNGCIAIDADRHKGPDGVAAYLDLTESFEFPAYPIIDTAGNGEHHLFKQPAGHRLSNGTGALPPGIDVRGHGGWIVAPGTRRPDGKVWKARAGTPGFVTAISNDSLPELPGVLLQAILDGRSREDNEPGPQPEEQVEWLPSSAEAVRVKSALRTIPAEDRDTWFRIGAALKHRFGESGFAPWRDWSMKSIKFNEETARYQWRSMKPEKGITIATLFDYAIKYGWQDTPATGRPTGPEGAEPVVVLENDDEPVPPREWLLGATFCKEFVSAIMAAGATGKTALRLLQLLALATGRALTREHVFRRCRVLLVCMEDTIDEIRRRLRAACLHYKLSSTDTAGYFFYVVASRRSGKIATVDRAGTVVLGPLSAEIERIVVERGIDLVCFDPFVKAHGVVENDNKMIDEVMQILLEIGARHKTAIDATHHIAKGTHAAGDSDQGRGASAMRDALRIGKTLMTMTAQEAQLFEIHENERRQYIRYDDAKTNLTPAGEAQWFKLVGVELGNSTAEYPSGDNVQTVEPWAPPATWEGITQDLADQIVARIDDGLPDGERYTDHGNSDRAAWRVVVEMAPGKKQAEAKRMVKNWVAAGSLERRAYYSRALKKGGVLGLWVAGGGGLL